MTNENPESPLKPQVIDLDAEDVIVDEADKPATPPPPPAPARKSIPPVAWLAVALLGGAVAGGWIYKDVLSSYLPSNELVTAQARIDTLEAQTKTLGEQLAAVSWHIRSIENRNSKRNGKIIRCAKCKRSS